MKVPLKSYVVPDLAEPRVEHLYRGAMTRVTNRRRRSRELAADGTVDADAFIGGGEVEVALTARRPFRVWSLLGFDACRVIFRGTALPGASGASQGATAVDAIAGVRLAWTFRAPFELSLRLSVGAPILRAEAVDQGKVVAGTSGALLPASLALIRR